jgi:hypothetical protein
MKLGLPTVLLFCSEVFSQLIRSSRYQKMSADATAWTTYMSIPDVRQVAIYVCSREIMLGCDTWSVSFQQGDRKCLWKKNRLKCCPSHFFIQNNAKPPSWKKVDQKMVVTFVFSKSVQSKQSLKGRKFARSGHPAFHGDQWYRFATGR